MPDSFDSKIIVVYRIETKKIVTLIQFADSLSPIFLKINIASVFMSFNLKNIINNNKE